MIKFMEESLNARLKSAMYRDDEFNDNDAVNQPEADNEELEGLDAGIETTPEEIEAFYIIKSIVGKVVSLSRIYMRDRKSYCGILLDNNNRKPICRLHFNRRQKYIGLFHDGGTEERISIDKLDDIYNFEVQLCATVASYTES